MTPRTFCACVVSLLPLSALGCATGPDFGTDYDKRVGRVSPHGLQLVVKQYGKSVTHRQRLTSTQTRITTYNTTHRSFGVIDRAGRVIVPVKHVRIKLDASGAIIVDGSDALLPSKLKKKWRAEKDRTSRYRSWLKGLHRVDGSLVLRPMYREIVRPHHWKTRDHFRFMTFSKKVGVISLSGRVIVPATLRYANIVQHPKDSTYWVHKYLADLSGAPVAVYTYAGKRIK